MPNKFNADHRHHIPKMRHFVRNWPEYESGLRNRGSQTFWVTPQAMQLWPAQARSTPGGQSIYSNQAIQTSLMLRLVFGQARRQTEGLMRSIFQLLEIDLKAPDHTTLSRRSMTLKALPRQCALPAGPLFVDRQHRAEAVWRRRMAAEKARTKVAA